MIEWVSLTKMVSPLTTLFRLLIERRGVTVRVWLTGGTSEQSIHVELRNNGSKDVTVDFGSVYSHYVYSSRHDLNFEETVEWRGPQLPYRLLSQSGPIRWHGRVEHATSDRDHTRRSALLAYVAGKRRRIYISSPPKEWTLTERT